jgi:hypothetical protein
MIGGSARRLALAAIPTLITILICSGVYVDNVRHNHMIEFAADDYFEHSIFRSILEAPREYQFYLHAAAIKKCVPYAWGYGAMGFYRLPPNVAVNVLPDKWLRRCSIHRT